jgi:hypothetical protein
MKHIPGIEEALSLINSDMVLIANRIGDSYEAAVRIWSIAFSHAPISPDLMHPLWLIWGQLTDRVETESHARADIDATMRRAAEEWLAIPSSDTDALKIYLDRWVYDEIGYPRPEDPSIGRPEFF